MRISALCPSFPSSLTLPKSIHSKISRIALPIVCALGLALVVVCPNLYTAILLTSSLAGALFFQKKVYSSQPLAVEQLPALFSPVRPCRLNIRLPNGDRLPEAAPRGIKDEGGCGWLNADLQLIESSVALSQWLKESPPAELSAFRDFLLEYPERSKKLSSGPLRAALLQLFPWAQKGMDPFDLLAYILDLSPQELKGRYRKTVYYNSRMTAIPSDLEIKDNEISIISLTIRGVKPQLDKMLNAFYTERPIGLKRTEQGVDGKPRIYRANRIERRFITAPSDLWFQIIRFENVVQKSIFHDIPFLKSIFPPIEMGIAKNNTPVSIPHEIEIEPIFGTPKLYRLNAFLVHEGTAPQENRVKAYRFKDNVLYGCHNDLVVKISHPAQQEILSQAYLLHYEPV